jgi:hypothetical protein
LQGRTKQQFGWCIPQFGLAKLVELGFVVTVANNGILDQAVVTWRNNHHWLGPKDDALVVEARVGLRTYHQPCDILVEVLQMQVAQWWNLDDIVMRHGGASEGDAFSVIEQRRLQLVLQLLLIDGG